MCFERLLTALQAWGDVQRASCYQHSVSLPYEVCFLRYAKILKRALCMSGLRLGLEGVRFEDCFCFYEGSKAGLCSTVSFVERYTSHGVIATLMNNTLIHI